MADSAKKEPEKAVRDELKQVFYKIVDDKTIGKEARNIKIKYKNSFVEVAITILKPDEYNHPKFLKDQKTRFQMDDGQFVLMPEQLRLDDFRKSADPQTSLDNFIPNEQFIAD